MVSVVQTKQFDLVYFDAGYIVCSIYYNEVATNWTDDEPICGYIHMESFRCFQYKNRQNYTWALMMKHNSTTKFNEKYNFGMLRTEYKHFSIKIFFFNV